jgi:hypothetical protein
VIKDNRFYQTAARTLTSAVQHAAIWTSGNFTGTTIFGNVIGFSSSSGTGVYQLTGTSTTNFYPININSGAGTQTSIQGNTISNISLSGNISGEIFSGIKVSAGIVK